MVDFIEEMYLYAQLIPSIKEIIEDCYADKTLIIVQKWNDIRDLLVDFCNLLQKNNNVLGHEIYECCEKATKYSHEYGVENYNRMADTFEDIIPLLYDAMKAYGEIDVEENGYRMASSKSGFIALENTMTKSIYNSFSDPMWEAYHLAKKIYDPKVLSYNLLGCELGYLAWQLYSISDCTAEINIYHSSKFIVDYAYNYGVLSWIEEEKLNVIIKDNNKELLESYALSLADDRENSAYILKDIVDLFNDEENNLINEFRANNYATTLFKDMVLTNLYRNIKNVKETYLDIPFAHAFDEWVVVMAGPSLDDHIGFLKLNQGKKGIICATTVLKKLLLNDIKPTCACALDPQKRTWGHMEGIEDGNIPLIINSVANWRFGELYKGKKYLAPSLSSSESCDYFEKRGIDSLYLGSTVAIMCVVMASKFGAKKIDLIGMDLAYPSKKTHASGTMDASEIKNDDMMLVKSVSGGVVSTTRQFKVYIDELVKVIKDLEGIDIINYSTSGAYFEGTKWHKEVDN